MTDTEESKIEISPEDKRAAKVLLISLFIQKVVIFAATALLLMVLWNTIVWQMFINTRKVSFSEMLGLYLFVQMLMKFHNLKLEGK